MSVITEYVAICGECGVACMHERNPKDAFTTAKRMGWQKYQRPITGTVIDVCPECHKSIPKAAEKAHLVKERVAA